MTDDRLRISNADRDMAIQQLQAALDEGRIDLAEFDERAKAVYGAKTNAELDIVFEDLPGGRPKAGEVAPVGGVTESVANGTEDASGREPRSKGLRLRELPALRGLISVGVICTGIWFATWIGTGEPSYFWPVWPILGLGIATVLQAVNLGFDGRDDDDEDEDDTRRDRGHGHGRLGH